MPTPALSGDHRDKLADAVAFAEINRRRARRIAAETQDRVRAELTARHSAIEMRVPDEVEVAVVADARTSANPRWKVAVSNERWGDDLATMYAAIVATEQSDFIIGQNAAIINLLGEIRDALRAKSS